MRSAYVPLHTMIRIRPVCVAAASAAANDPTGSALVPVPLAPCLRNTEYFSSTRQTSVAGDASGTYSAILARRGVALADASLSRFDGRIAYVIGGRAKDPKPLFFVEKDAFQPLRLVSSEGGGALVDVRLLSWGSPMGGDWFPGAVEVWRGEAALLRFATEKTVANGKLDPSF